MNDKLMIEAEFLTHLKDNKTQVEEELKQIKKQIENQEKKLIDMMVESELQNFKGKNGITYSLKTTVIPNVLAENKVALVEALKENGYAGILILSNDKLNPSSSSIGISLFSIPIIKLF